jgi:predicted RNA-binding protein with PIN domain
MVSELIIDGYNLLHLAGLGQRTKAAGGLENARKKLLKRLSRGLLPEERLKTTVVFDAQYAEHKDRHPLQADGMTVLFSPRGWQADDLIEEMLRHSPLGKQIMVVSSDHRIQRAARAARAEVMDCDAFLVELDRREELAQRGEKPDSDPQEKPAAAPQTPPGRDELETWMAEFGGIDVHEIQQEVQRERTPKSGPKPLPGKKRPPAPAPEKSRTSPPSSTSVPGRTVSGQLEPEAAESAASAQKSESICEDELSFWEQRVAELSDEDDSQKRGRS